MDFFWALLHTSDDIRVSTSSRKVCSFEKTQDLQQYQQSSKDWQEVPEKAHWGPQVFQVTLTIHLQSEQEAGEPHSNTG